MSQSITSIDTIDKPLDNIIYKVKLLIDKKIDTVYIFNGKKDKDTKDAEIIKNIFSQKEQDEFQLILKLFFVMKEFIPMTL